MTYEAQITLPDWTWEFHGHRCPFMPIGYRMGVVAMREMGIGKVKDHGAIALVEMGVGHPQTCLMDGVMSATGCTYGKLMMERLNYGKVATLLHVPGKGAVRVYLKSDFQDLLGKEEFFDYRKKGVEPSDIPFEVTERTISLVMKAKEEDLFKIERLPDFSFVRPKGSFSKVKCSMCGEYVFERYVRTKDGKPACIPCSGFTESRLDPMKGMQ